MLAPKRKVHHRYCVSATYQEDGTFWAEALNDLIYGEIIFYVFDRLLNSLAYKNIIGSHILEKTNGNFILVQ